MGRIVISDDKSLENLDIRFDHLLLGKDELEREKGNFIPLESLLEKIPENFFPSILINSNNENAANSLSGDDELELFFLIILSKGKETELLDKLRNIKDTIEPEKYRDMLIFLFLHADESRNEILSEIKRAPASLKDGIQDIILAVYDNEPHEISFQKGTDFLYATFFEALKAEKLGDHSRAFSLMLTLFEKTGFHSFIFEILKFYVVQYNGIKPEQIDLFSSKVTESPITVSYSDLKFIEFLYYYRNNIEEKIESSVSALAESTDSIFILNVIAPLLYKFRKWHLIGKFYKLSAKRTTGAERTKYLELLADIYENKLDMPDFATEIHKNIVEDDPMSCSVSLSRVLSVYEENGAWNDLFNLYSHLSDREEDESLKAYYLYKAGDVLHRELGRSSDARDYLEKSVAIKHSFEVVRTLSEIYLKMHDYDAYIKTLLKELEFSLDPGERIRVLNIIADVYINQKKDYVSAQKYLLSILEIAPDNLSTIKKLGKIYYQTKSWKNLTDINFREIDLTRDLGDTVNLYYRNGSIFFKELGDMERAQECFMEILEIEPDHVPSLLYLEKIYMRKKDIGNLIVLYKRLLEQSHTDSDTRQYYMVRLGIIYRDNDMTAESIEIFKAISKMFPDNIMARENLRMIEGKPDFSESNAGDYIEQDLELFAELIKNKDHTDIAGHYLHKSENSFWKYLYFVNKNEHEEKTENYLPSKTGNNEEFLISLLERKYSIENLIKNSSKKAALMLLVEKYLDEGYYRGIHTILKYYLKFEPENKRKIWELFFRGYNNPDLKEEFETILLGNPESEQIDVIRSILEKIYMKEKDWKTVLFMRNLFIKKCDDIKEKCALIDDTIQILSENLTTEQLIELYQLRLRTTPSEERTAFNKKYLDFLNSIGRTDLLTDIYEAEWNEQGNVEAGRQCLEHYINEKNDEKAIKTAREILEKEWDIKIFETFISLLKKNGDVNLAISEVTSRLDKSEGETAQKLRSTLFDLNIEAGYVSNAIDLFNKTAFPNQNERAEKGLQLIKRMEGENDPDKKLELLRSLMPDDRNLINEKLNLIIESGGDITESDIEQFSSYDELCKVIESELSEKNRQLILDHFSSRNDPEAKKTLINTLIKDGDVENAAKMIDLLDDEVTKSIFHSKIAWKKGDYEQEKRMLKDIIFSAISKKETYPLKRLATLEKENRRLVYFLNSALRLTNEKTEEDDLYPRVFAVDKNEIFDFTGFDRIDDLLKEYLHIISFGKRDETKMPGKPLNSVKHREIVNLVEYIKLSANFDDLTAVFDESLELPFEIVPAKLPCIAFGPKSLEMDIKDLKFRVIRNAFLLSCGMRNSHDESGIEHLAATLTASLKLEGKGKVQFIKNVRPNFQSRLLEIFNQLENTEDTVIFKFLEKIFSASFYHAFSLVPDIEVALQSTKAEVDSLSDPDSKFVKIREFIYRFFF